MVEYAGFEYNTQNMSISQHTVAGYQKDEYNDTHNMSMVGKLIRERKRRIE